MPYRAASLGEDPKTGHGGGGRQHVGSLQGAPGSAATPQPAGRRGRGQPNQHDGYTPCVGDRQGMPVPCCTRGSIPRAPAPHVEAAGQAADQKGEARTDGWRSCLENFEF